MRVLRYVSISCVVGVFAVSVAALVAAAATHSDHTDSPRLGKEVAVIVELRGKQVVAVLTANANRWRVGERIPVKHGIRSIAWDPTSRKLAVTTAGGNLSNELRVIDLARGGQRTLARAKRGDPAAFFGSLAWSPNGRWIAVTRSVGLYDAELNIFDASSGSLSRSFRVSARHDSSVAWSPNGASLYFAEQKSDRVQPRLRRLIVRTGRVLPIEGIRGLDPTSRSDDAVFFSRRDGIAVLKNGRVHKVVGSKAGDRFPTWLDQSKALLVERPTAGCPRFANPGVCSRVIVLMKVGAAPRNLIKSSARNPTTR